MSINKIQELAYRCYKILPLVYDESLSYYEVICKCAQKLNEVIDTVDEMIAEFNQWESLIADIESSFDTIESTLAQHSTQISGLQGDIAGLEQTIESMAESITSLTSQISTLSSTVAGHTSQISTLETNVGNIQNNKMNKVNPTGTGAFSMNRKSQTNVGTNSVAVGNNPEASGNYSTAEGNQSKATAPHSHAEGDHTHAAAQGSHAEGYYTVANGQYQHVAGKYNKANNTALRITGDGTSASEANRSNAEMLDESGNLKLKGDVYVGCNNDSSGGSKLLSSSSLYRHQIRIQTTGLTAAGSSKGEVFAFYNLYSFNSVNPTAQQMKINARKEPMYNAKFLTSNEVIISIDVGESTLNVHFIDASTGKYSTIAYNYVLSDAEVINNNTEVLP